MSINELWKVLTTCPYAFTTTDVFSTAQPHKECFRVVQGLKATRKIIGKPHVKF